MTDPTGTSSGVDELPSPALDILQRLGSSDDGGESGGSSSVPIFDFLKALWGGITSLASAVWQGIKGIATTIWSSLKSVGRAVASWFKSPHPSFVQGLRSLAGALGGLVLAVVLAPIFVILGGLIHSVYTLFAGDRASTSATSRPLSKPERDLLHEYFGDSIDYDAVTVARDGLAAVGAPRTVANTISLKSSWGQFVGDGLDLSDYGRRTLVHEMTHVWQYQHYGSAYMAESLANQFDAWVSKGDRDAAYEWTGLVDSGVPFEQWNPEQQAMAVEDYYALQNGLDFRINGTPVTDPAQRESWKAKLAPIVSKLKGP